MAEQKKLIAGYRVHEVLGYGAASTVYRASDPKDGAIYALKHLVKQTERDQRCIDQAINEHEVASNFDQPMLRKSYKMVRVRSMLRMTEFALVMEFVEGSSLEATRPGELRDLVRVFKAVARGLEAMHTAGYVHADMKPMNVILTPDGEVKLIDFGQSCPTLTTKERIQGTPSYIAPEQVSLEPLTPYTDMFNFGATMYWCLTDHNVPTKIRQRAKDRVGERHLVSRARSSSKLIDPRKYVPDLPGALASLVLDCLQPDPRDRPGSMSEIRARLNIGLYQIERRHDPDAAFKPHDNEESGIFGASCKSE